MKIERLSVENLREGVFCGHGQTGEREMWDQLEAWLRGDILRGQIARADDGQVAGFILYYPIENAPLDVSGDGLYMVQCVFVKPEHWGKGIGRALIESAISDASSSGASGIAVEGFSDVRRGTFDYMPSSFFDHMDMEPGESRGSGTLYFRPLQDDAEPPHYLQPGFEPPAGVDRIRIDILDCRRCFVRVKNRELVRSVLSEVEANKPALVIHNQNERAAIVDKGMSSGIFIDGKLTFFSGPITEDDVWQAIDVADSAHDQHIDR